MGGELGGERLSVDPHLGGFRFFVGIVDPGELLDQAGPGFGIESLAVSFLAHLERGGDVDEDESADRLDPLTDLASGGPVRGNGRTDGDAAVLGDLGGDIARCGGC